MSHATRRFALASAVVLSSITLPEARAGVITIYDFGRDAQSASPLGSIALDKAGNLYGATPASASDEGTVYRLSPTHDPRNWSYSDLWTFTPGPVGFDPSGGVTLGPGGTLYGTTRYNRLGINSGCGSVFGLHEGSSGAWRAEVVWKFLSEERTDDGCTPWVAPVLGADGALYGTAQDLGADKYGAVYRAVIPSRSQPRDEQSIHAYTGGSDGLYPESPVLADPSGAIFATAIPSPSVPILRLSPPGLGTSSWRMDLVWEFQKGDCAEILGPMVEDAFGSLYGACSDNVENNADSPGTIFQLSPPAPGESAWSLAILYRFTGGADGGHPRGGLALDDHGNLFGTTTAGRGTLFELSPPVDGGGWTLKTLWTFSGTDGSDPEGAVTIGPDGTVFGTTFGGGAFGKGTVFQYRP